MRDTIQSRAEIFQAHQKSLREAQVDDLRPEKPYRDEAIPTEFVPTIVTDDVTGAHRRMLALETEMVELRRSMRNVKWFAWFVYTVVFVIPGAVGIFEWFTSP